MSVSTLYHPPHHKAALAKFWLAVAFVIAVGVGLAWLGAQSASARVVRVDTIEAGSGPLIQPVDGVFVEYEGRLPDGTVFDSSDAHGGPQPMIAGQVIPGFAEALGKMREGGRYRVHIPSRLAYGAEPPQGSPIPPDADLAFDVHIVELVPNAALIGSGGRVPEEQQPQRPQN